MEGGKTTVTTKNSNAQVSLTREGNKLTLEMKTKHGNILTIEKEKGGKPKTSGPSKY